MNPLRDLQLPRGRLRHPLFIYGQGHDRRTVLDGVGDHRIDAGATVLQVDGVDDRPTGELLERGLDDVDLGRIDDQRRRDTLRQQLDQGAHLLALVLPLRQRDAHIQEVRSAFHLVTGDAQDLVVVVVEQQPLHLPRPLTVHPLADQGGGGVLRHGERFHGAGGAGDVLHLAHERLRSPDAIDHLLQMLGRGAAAAADDVDAELHELVVPRRQLIGGEAVDGDTVDVVRKPGVGDHADWENRVIAQVADRLPHVLRSRGAVEADDVHLDSLERDHRGLDVGAEQHAAGGVEGRLHLYRAKDARLTQRLPDPGDRRLQLQDVLTGLYNKEVDSPFDQSRRLFTKYFHQLVVGDVA